MTRLLQHVGLISAMTVCLGTFARGATQNPPRALTDYANEIKPKAKKLSQDLADAIKSGSNPLDAIGAYNRSMEALRVDFVNRRKAEYQAVREVRQENQVAAEESPVNPGSARHSTNADETYVAPTNMKFESFDWHEVSNYGDTTKDHSLSDADTKLHIHLNARSLIKPRGRSRVEVQPVTKWMYIDPSGHANDDWNTVNKLINQ